MFIDKLSGIGEEKKQRAEYKRKYYKYLRSQEWRQKVIEAQVRAKFACQLCGDNEGGLEVHHRTYVRMGRENPEDLTVLCRVCHDWFHKGFRDQREIVVEKKEKIYIVKKGAVPEGDRRLPPIDTDKGRKRRGKELMKWGK